MERRTAVALSGTAHAGVIVWALVAGLFNPVDDSEKLSIAEVSVVSSAEFDALLSNAPEAVETPVLTAPAAPEPQETPPPPAPAEETPPPAAAPQPETPEAPPPDASPDTSQLAPPPRTEVAPEVPDAPASPAEAPDAAIAETPAPRPVDRVAAVPTPAPPPMVETAPQVEAPATPTPAEAETPVEEAPAPAAPEEAAPVIVTEADTPAAAPERSIRPARRPARPVPAVAAVEPEDEPEDAAPPAPAEAAAESPAPDTAPDPAPEAPRTIDTFAALAEANASGSPAPSAPAGPPLTQGERDGLRVAVSRCWNLGSLSTEALRTTVTIYMEVGRDGVPRADSIRLDGFEGGSEASARQAYEAGRRAILQCGRDGFELPADKYEQWKEIEMTFNPDQMRQR